MNNQQQGNAAAGGGQEDYVDKGKRSTPLQHEPGGWKSDKLFTGVDALEKKFGQGKVDPVKERETNEKVTDKARGFLESKGVHIPKNVSHEFRFLLKLHAE